MKDFDLKRRLFKYPCSYMIYSAQFAALPEVVKEGVTRKLRDGLLDEDATYAHIPKEEKKVIREILSETVKMEF